MCARKDLKGVLAHCSVIFMCACVCSDVKGAGTDADVHVVVYGEKGDTGERLLDNSLQDNFERSKVRRGCACMYCV